MNPRRYLSWSSMDLFTKDRARWIRQYIHDDKMPPTAAMEFGSLMADGLEHGTLTGEPELDAVMLQLPRFEVMDQPFEAKITRKGKPDIQILCKPDTMKADMTAFKEYKTGTTRWTRKMVDDHGQITFYAAGMYLYSGRIPGDIELVHVPTEKDAEGPLEGKIRATGAIHRFHTQRDLSQVLKMVIRMRKTWEEMERVVDAELL